MAKKTITIEIDEETFNGLNNAVIAYTDVIWGIYLGCEVDTKFEPLKSLPEEKLLERKDKVLNFYKEIEKQFLI